MTTIPNHTPGHLNPMPVEILEAPLELCNHTAQAHCVGVAAGALNILKPTCRWTRRMEDPGTHIQNLMPHLKTNELRVVQGQEHDDTWAVLLFSDNSLAVLFHTQTGTIAFPHPLFLSAKGQTHPVKAAGDIARFILNRQKENPLNPQWTWNTHEALWWTHTNGDDHLSLGMDDDQLETLNATLCDWALSRLQNPLATTDITAVLIAQNAGPQDQQMMFELQLHAKTETSKHVQTDSIGLNTLSDITGIHTRCLEKAWAISQKAWIKHWGLQTMGDRQWISSQRQNDILTAVGLKSAFSGHHKTFDSLRDRLSNHSVLAARQKLLPWREEFHPTKQPLVEETPR